jgi:hypothetical protein
MRGDVVMERATMSPWRDLRGSTRATNVSNTSVPTAEPNNLCGAAPAAATPPAFGNYQPFNALSGTNGGTKSIAFDGRVPPVVTIGSVTSGWSMGCICTVARRCACSTTTPCLSGAAVQLTGVGTTLCVSGAPVSGTCPLPTYSGAGGKKPTGSPCTVNAECASNACVDLLGIVVPGEAHDPYCK